MDNRSTQEHEAAAKNPKFVQLRKDAMPEFRSLVRRNPVGMEILILFFQHMDRYTNAIAISYTMLQEELGYGRNTIAKALKGLRDENWIQVGRMGNMNVYAVDDAIAWQSSNQHRKHCWFRAMVGLTSTEQEPGYEKAELRRVPAYFRNLADKGEVA